MRYFVVHHPVLTERKKSLVKQFEEFGIEDPEWVTSFPPEEAMKIKEYTGTPIPLGYVSCNMKHYSILKKMVAEDIPEAVIFEDDVVFTKRFDPSKIPRQFPYVKLEIHSELMDFMDVLPDAYATENNGGICAYYVRKEFAEVFIRNINLRHAMDLEIQNVLFHKFEMYDIVACPMCYQVHTESVINTREGLPEKWKTYVLTKWAPVYTYDELVTSL